MKSPFPGMDPYLEGYLWPDVHNGLAFVIKEILSPLISPKYVARTDLYTVSDSFPEEEIGIMYPDVEVLKRKHIRLEEPLPAYGKSDNLSPVTITIPNIETISVRIPVIEIRDTKHNQLITAIEILSPVNKRKPGLEPYREKRKRLCEAGVHLLEIDLLRRGTRPFAHPAMPEAHYVVTLIRAGSFQTDVWAFNVTEPLPVVPVPLRVPDEDVPLNLGKALNTIYERSMYHLSINYRAEPPPPVFEKEITGWIQKSVAEMEIEETE